MTRFQKLVQFRLINVPGILTGNAPKKWKSFVSQNWKNTLWQRVANILQSFLQADWLPLLIVQGYEGV